MKKFVEQIFSDVDGQGSSKRLATFVILALIVVIVIAVTFFKSNLQEHIWNDLVWTFWLCLGFITSEKFTKRSP